MHLMDAIDRLKNKKSYRSKTGHVDIVFEIHEHNSKDASGFTPIIIKLSEEEKSKKKSLL